MYKNWQKVLRKSLHMMYKAPLEKCPLKLKATIRHEYQIIKVSTLFVSICSY